MKKIIVTLFVVMIAIVAHAQDVIVKKDGSTILSNVIEVSDTQVKYKKHSNPKGPTYTINTSELLCINYKNGEKDDYGNVEKSKISQTSGTNSQSSSKPSTPVIPFNQNESRNIEYINTFNNSSLNFIGGSGKAKAVYCTLGLSRDSEVMDNNIIVEYSLGEYHQSNIKEGKLFSPGYSQGLRHWDFGLITTINNISDRTIYIDLANCFFQSWRESRSYYTGIPNMEMNNSAVANQQRIVDIPPHSKKVIGYQALDFLTGFKEYKSYPTYRGKLLFFTNNIKNKGDRMVWTEENAPLFWGTLYTYSFTMDFSNKYSVIAKLYVKDAIGGDWNKFASQPVFRDFNTPQNINVLYMYGNFKEK